MRAVLHAIALLTIVPVRSSWEDERALGRAMAAFPLVGALIGALAAAVGWLLTRPALSPRATLLGAALVLAVLEGLTGLLHLDGWADCCDALLPPMERARRFDVLKDPRLGTFGVAGAILLLGVKLGALYALLGPGTKVAGLLPVVAAPMLGRMAPVAAAALMPLAREGGMAAALRKGLSPPTVAIAAITTAVGAAFLGWRGAGCLAAAAVAASAVGRVAYTRIGGVTGDVYGAMVELAETAALAAAALLGR